MLTFNLKKQWFDKIKSGEKTHEYREMSSYWNKRFINLFKKSGAIVALNSLRRSLINRHSIELYPDFEVCFTCGYPSRQEKDKFLYGHLVCLTTCVNGKNTDLAIDKNVYDIEFELIGE